MPTVSEAVVGMVLERLVVEHGAVAQVEVVMGQAEHPFPMGSRERAENVALGPDVFRPGIPEGVGGCPVFGTERAGEASLHLV